MVYRNSIKSKSLKNVAHMIWLGGQDELIGDTMMYPVMKTDAETPVSE